MQQAILTLNVGSSSIKFSLFSVHDLQRIFYGQIASIDSSPYLLVKNNDHEILADEKINLNTSENALLSALKILLTWLNQYKSNYKIMAAGHRVVHGGEFYSKPVIVDANVMDNLKTLTPLAPLHQPYNLAGIELLAAQLKDIPQIACFDTAFHADLPKLEQMYALPAHIASQSIKRYGFHGLSYEYIAQVLPNHLGEMAANNKIIVAHLGHGASMCALKNRKSIATTMGFTALDGLPMSTRCGNLDPGAVLYLLAQPNMTIEKLTQLFYEKSGLLGISGISGDVKILLENKSIAAKKAIDLFVYRIHREMGSLVATLNGLDSLIFTAGIGEHACQIRAQVCQQSSWLKIKLDESANLKNDLKISMNDSHVSVWVIPTDEELVIARHAMGLVFP